MGYTNVQADVNFRRQAFNQDGIKYVTGPYTSYNQDDFRAFTAVTDCVITCLSYVGDSLTSQNIYAGTTVYGLFRSITVTSGKAILHLAGYSRISDLVNSYYNTANQYGYFSEAETCTSQRLNPYLTRDLYNKASWMLFPSQYEEDFVRAFKPTDDSGSLSFTRSSDATRTNSSGEIERVAWNLLTFSEQFENAAWSKSSVSVSSNTTTAPNGTLTADTISADGTLNIHVVLHSLNAVNGVSYTHSVYAKKGTNNFIQLIGGVAVYTSGLVFANFDLNNGVVGSVGAGTTATITNVGNGWYRCTITATATVTVTGNGFIINLVTSATSSRGENNTLSTNVILWGAQVVEGTEAKPYLMTTNRQDVPRLDYRNADGTVSTCPRLLLEPQRTNSIRNSTMVGAVAGSPGTAPTNWTVVAAGLTQTIVGTGTESGLQYIDFRFNGTATGSSLEIRQETPTQIVAANGQTWTLSSYLKLISGSVGGSSFGMYERTSAGTVVTSGFQSFTITSSLQRAAYTRTLSGGATVGAIQPTMLFGLTIGATYDFTIRIAAPQMELGAYATTFIPTTTAAVTRTADAASKTGVSSLIGQTEGTMFIETASINVLSASGGVLFSIATDINNRIVLFVSLGGALVFSRSVSGVVVDIFTIPNFISSTAGRAKIAFAYKAGDYAYSINGSAAVTSTNSAVTPAMSRIDLASMVGLLPIDIRVAQAALFPTRLSNEDLAFITTL